MRLGVGAGLAAEDRAGVGSGSGEILVGDAEELDEGGIEVEVDLFERGTLGQDAGGRGRSREAGAFAVFAGLVAAFGEADPIERDRGLLSEDAGQGAVEVEGGLDAVEAFEQRLPAADGIGVIVDVGRREREGRHFVGVIVGFDEGPIAGRGAASS